MEEAGCLLHTGSHILRLGPRSWTIEHAETREQGIRKRNHPPSVGEKQETGEVEAIEMSVRRQGLWWHGYLCHQQVFLTPRFSGRLFIVP